MTLKRDNTRKMRVVHLLRPEGTPAEAAYRQTDADLGFEEKSQAEVGACVIMTSRYICIHFIYFAPFNVISTLVNDGISLQRPRLLILPRVLHNDERTSERIYHAEHDKRRHPEGTDGVTHDYEH